MINNLSGEEWGHPTTFDFSWLNAIDAPIFVLDENKIYYANQNALALAGVSLLDMVDQDFGRWLVARNDEETSCLEDLTPLLSEGDCRTHFLTQHNGMLPVRISIRPLLAPTDDSASLRKSLKIVTLRDVPAEELSLQQHTQELIAELSQRRRELEALVTVASALHNTIVQEEMFPIILDQFSNQFKADGASLLLPNPNHEEITVALAVGEWKETTGQHLARGQGISWQVIDKGNLYVNNAIQNEPDLARTVFAGGLPCGVCVPLRSHSTLLGLVWLGRNDPFGEDDIRLLAGIADISASNVYRARLFEQTQERFQRLSGLHSIDMAITSSLDLKLTLDVLLDQVVAQMQVNAADILLFDPGLYWLEFAAGRGFVHAIRTHAPRSLNDSPAGQVALERQMISIPDLAKANISTEYWFSPDEGFQSYFAAPLIAKGHVKGVLELYHRHPYQPDSEWLAFLETLATQAAIAIDNAELFEHLQRSNEELSMAYDATIEGWSHALELRDQETHGHAQRVTDLTVRLARQMGVRDEEIQYYRRGVLLHDIGKMAIPDRILFKEGPLTSAEQEIMRQHPSYAYELLLPIGYLRPSLDIPYAHHEWWDGTGYPRQLKGEKIPLAARIFAVVDVWDALRNKRSYRPAWGFRKVKEHILSLSGTHFDPLVVREFMRMISSDEQFTRE